jgi:hypothetical protein
MKLYQFRDFFVIQIGMGKEQDWRMGETARVYFKVLFSIYVEEAEKNHRKHEAGESEPSPKL